MSEYQRIAEDLISSLALAHAPIALSFSDAPPPNVTAFDGVVPAGCSFWQQAAAKMFYTSTKDHELCAIGLYTHHLAEPSASYQSELADVLAAMSGLDYVRAHEVAAIPVVERAVKHVVYGPLAEFLSAPAVALLFAHARQGLIVSEAVSRVDKGMPLAMGRPACAVVPQVINQGRAVMSLGCCGARAYLDILADGVAMWAFPGDKLDQYCTEIVNLARANQSLAAFHTRRKEDVAADKRPSVRQSLERLSAK